MPLVFEIFEDSETEISKYVIKSFAIARMMIWNMLLAFESFIATENDVLEYAVCLKFLWCRDTKGANSCEKEC